MSDIWCCITFFSNNLRFSFEKNPITIERNNNFPLTKYKQYDEENGIMILFGYNNLISTMELTRSEFDYEYRDNKDECIFYSGHELWQLYIKQTI